MNVLTAEEVTVVEEGVHEDLNGMRMATVKVCRAQTPRQHNLA